MANETSTRLVPLLSVPLSLSGSLTYAQIAAPASAPVAPPAAAVPAAPLSLVTCIRNKLAAGDLLSAESILEVHREKNGEDGPWLAGLGWLARGAMLTGDLEKAGRYAAQGRQECAARLAKGALLTTDRDLEVALGAAIEVEAQRLEKTRGQSAAVAYVRGELADIAGTPTFRSRLHKRIAIYTFEGHAAPELVVEEHAGATAPPSLAAEHGQPVVLFMWAEWCGDCKAQAASLSRVLERHRASGLRCIAVTRHYEDGDSARTVESSRADSVWTAFYSGPAAGLREVPRVVSTASMIEYGISATPTFVFIDRLGLVRRYTPTRLSEAELELAVADIVR